MTTRDIAKLSCKILAIYTVVNAIKVFGYIAFSSSSFLQQLNIGTKILLIITSFMPFVLLSVLGIILWLYADQFAKHIVSDKDLPVEELKPNSENIQVIAFTVVGIFVLADAIPRLTEVFSSIILLHSLQEQHIRTIHADTIARAIGLIIQFIIGFWLFLGSHGIVGLLKKLREAGIKDSEDV